MLKNVMEIELQALELVCDKEAARLLEELLDNCGNKCGGIVGM